MLHSSLVPFHTARSFRSTQLARSVPPLLSSTFIRPCCNTMMQSGLTVVVLCRYLEEKCKGQSVLLKYFRE